MEVSKIRRLINKFENTGSIMDSKSPMRRYTDQPAKNIA